MIQRNPEQPRTADEFFQDKALLASAVRHAVDSVIITDAALDEPGPRIVYVNPAFTRMTGYSPQDVLGKTPRILQGPATDRAALDRIRACLTRGEVFYGEAVNYRKDGTPFHNEWHIEPILDPAKGPRGGRITHFLALQRDVSERRRLEDDRRRQQERLAEKNFALQELFTRRELEKRALGEDVFTNVEEVILPLIARLRGRAGAKDREHLNRLEEQIRGMLADLGIRGERRRSQLSVRERAVADLVGQGRSNKEIAAALTLSVKTVETHRSRIRRKLGLVGQGINLTSFLQTG